MHLPHMKILIACIVFCYSPGVGFKIFLSGDSLKKTLYSLHVRATEVPTRTDFDKFYKLNNLLMLISLPSHVGVVPSQFPDG